MLNTIYIATKNEHKVAEIKRILKPINVQLKSISDYNHIPEAIEDGDTFAANAKLKAEHYFKYINRPVIADDSGLVVPALNGEPGIYSARYAGENSNYALNNQKLLKKMENLKYNDRFAYFVCSAVYKDGNSVFVAEGKCEGRIILKERGVQGFGYDPIFEYLQLNQTFAEIKPEIKNTISHRYLAFTELAKILNEYWNDIDKS